MSWSSAISVSGSFTAASQASSAVQLRGDFNVTIYGTFSATVLVQRSFDGGTTWTTVSTDGTGSLASYTTVISVAGYESQYGVLYRLYCSVYGSGTVDYLLSGNID